MRNLRLPILALLLSGLLVTPEPGALRAEEIGTEVEAWLDSLEIDPRVLDELASYSREHGDWPDGTPERLALAFRERVRNDVARAMKRIAAGEAEAEVKVNYLSPRDFAHGRPETRDERGREFEDGVIRTEQFHFFEGLDVAPATALAKFTDPEFRKQNSSRIEELREEGDLSCLKTKGMWGLLDPTWTCNLITLLDSGTAAAEHSQVVSNPGDDEFQTIYFKESVKVFVTTPDGLALYYINYTRSSKLGSLKKKLGRGRIESAQQERAEALAEMLHSSPE